LLADIGGSTTDVAVFKDNSICHTSILPVGGYQISRDISIGLCMFFESAEKLKKKYGDVTPMGNAEPGEEKTVAWGNQNISLKDLSEIIRARTDELIRLIVMELPEKDYAHYIPSGMVVTGGGANLVGAVDMAREITRFPVRLGTPVNLPGVSDSLEDPAYATAVGLLLWRSRNNTAQTPKAKTGISGMVSPVLRLFKK